MMFTDGGLVSIRLVVLLAAALIWTPVAAIGADTGANSVDARVVSQSQFQGVSHTNDGNGIVSGEVLEGVLERASEAASVQLQEDQSMLFGVYPGGGNGEFGSIPAPDPDTVIARLNELRGDQAFDIHLYTAWSWHSDEALDQDIERYTSSGFVVSLTIKYSPPPGREGDVEGYEDFVRQVVQRYASNPNVHQFVIGNEVNVEHGNPSSSDGPFAGVREATIAGVLAAAESIDQTESDARVGFSVAVLDRDTDIQFLRALSELGGAKFVSSVAFLGLHVYPGLWPVGSGDAYADMAAHLQNARTGLNQAGFGAAVDIAVLENGYPTADLDMQREKLDSFVQAVCDVQETAGVSTYSWFDLWDADSASDNQFAHYGLLRSDMSTKPAFDTYREFVASGCE